MELVVVWIFLIALVLLAAQPFFTTERRRKREKKKKMDAAKSAGKCGHTGRVRRNNNLGDDFYK